MKKACIYFVTPSSSGGSRADCSHVSTVEQISDKISNVGLIKEWILVTFIQFK